MIRGEKPRWTQKLLGMEVADEGDRVGRMLKSSAYQAWSLRGIGEIAPRSATQPMVETTETPNRVRPVRDLQDGQGVAVPRHLVIVRARMVWFLRSSSPIILSHRIVGPGNGSSVDHARKS